MTHSLPKKPNLILLKKQARKLLKDYRDDNAKQLYKDAVSCIQKYHPKPETFGCLRDSQLVIACIHGFRDWAELSHEVEIALINLKSLDEQTNLFINLACVQYAGNDNAALYKKANRLLVRTPEISSHDFYSAIVANNTRVVSAFLAQNKALATQLGGPFNWPALLYATYSRIKDNSENPEAIKIVTLLLEHGADPDSFVELNDTYKFTALTGAMGEGEGGEVHQPAHQHASDLVRLLLKAGANPNDAQGLYNTMFSDNSTKWLTLLKEYGLHARNKVNWKQESVPQSTFDFLLAYAVKHGLQERVSFLLKHGANPNAIDAYDKRTIYSLALLMGFPSIANELVEHGANIETFNIEDTLKQAIANRNITSINEILTDQPQLLTVADFIHHAALRSDLKTVTHLISLGFDVNGISKDGRSLLHVYAWEDNLKAVKKLVDLGANTECKDRVHQSNPLGHAIYNQATAVIEYLLEQSTNIIDVVCCAHVNRLRTLLDTDPKLLHTRTPRGNTLMHIIGFSLDGELEDNHYSDVIDHLIALGMDINILNSQGLTPLDFANETLNEQMVDLLTERGGKASL